MKRILSIVLMLAICLSAASTATAYESGDPCLLYGYDPDTRDDYETYGDEVFFWNDHPINKFRSPSGVISIRLNKYATQNIAKEWVKNGYYESGTYLDYMSIINEKYFSELDISEIMVYYSTIKYACEYAVYGKIPYTGYEGEIAIVVKLKDISKECVKQALKELAPRIDIDISSVYAYSYDLSEVSNALKYIAGWGAEYEIAKYDVDHDGTISLVDVTYMLKVIAGWDMSIPF